MEYKNSAILIWVRRPLAIFNLQLRNKVRESGRWIWQFISL